MINHTHAKARSDGDPTKKHPGPPFLERKQKPPGTEDELKHPADHGEHSYKGSGKLLGRAALITGGDSGIGRAVAIAFAREGADVLISYLNEDEDARETARWVEKAGQKAILVPGDIGKESHCNKLVARAVKAFGRIDVLVNNAAYQNTFDDITQITAEEWDRTFRVNIDAMFFLVKAAVNHMPKGGSIINTASINSDSPSPDLLAYATSKGAISNFTAGLAQMLAKRGLRVNSVAPGPIWTPLIPSTMSGKRVRTFGSQVPFKRPGQPAELAPVYVLLASQEASYISGAMIPVTGGEPIL
jgi:NAD(P)-dependent dehydrogenase (short-subunit alcohol dehydrogenase family)